MNLIYGSRVLHHEVGTVRREILNAVGDDATVEDVLDYVVGYYDEWNRTTTLGNYTLYRDSCSEIRSKWWQRLNKLWVFPVMMVAVLPAKWIITGKWGIDVRSKAAEVLTILAGDD